MQRDIVKASAVALSVGLFTALPAAADPFFFSTGNPNGLMATASRPDIPSGAEIESADDFILANQTQITSATFTGLLPTARPRSATLVNVVVEIYRVFPNDSNIGRTSGPPTFSTRSSADARQIRRRMSRSKIAIQPTSTLSFSADNTECLVHGCQFGIERHPSAAQRQTTGGEGPVTGEEVQFTVNFASPFDLPADHYFFVPQVELSSGNFFWLSAARSDRRWHRTPFRGVTDLQEWIRNAALDPDWLRVATDIVGVATPGLQRDILADRRHGSRACRARFGRNCSGRFRPLAASPHLLTRTDHCWKGGAS